MKVVFLDRDGIVNEDIGYIYKIDEFKFMDGIFEICQRFINNGYSIIIVTNQSGIARGYYSMKDFRFLNAWMIDEFSKHNIDILDVFICPHGPDSGCNCRKPKPGMLIEASRKFDIDMKSSWMIGDSERDIEAANLAGINNTILLDSESSPSYANSKFAISSLKEVIDIVV